MLRTLLFRSVNIVLVERLRKLYAFFFFQAEDGIRDLVRSRGLGDVYKRQRTPVAGAAPVRTRFAGSGHRSRNPQSAGFNAPCRCLLYTSDAADERSSVDLGGRRIIKKKNISRARPRTC